MRARAGVLALIAALVSASFVRAQDPGLDLQAVRRDTIKSTATVTVPFTVANQRNDTVAVTPRIELPADWTVLMGNSAFSLAPHATEMLMFSVVVPSRTRAGIYTIRVALTAWERTLAVDSVVVLVPERRGLELTLLDRPGFVVSGKTYDVGFLLRNRGNSASTVRLRASSTRGAVAVPETTVMLNAEESRVIRAHVRTPAGLQSATDDVMEYSAAQPGDTAAPAEASARVTIVPEPSRKIEEYLRVPTQVLLRAASSDGVAPFEVSGHGLVRDGGSTALHFLFRGPTGDFSAFGERDEYRIEMSAPSWTARAGDHLFMLSPLTGAAQPGFGFGGDATRGKLSAGAYGQHFRRQLQGGDEAGAFLSFHPIEDTRLAVNLVDRSGPFLSGRIGSATAAFHRSGFRADAELAGSQGAATQGMARAFRLSGQASGYTYDVGHQYADTGFSGAQHGAEHTYVVATMNRSEVLSFAASGSQHRTDLSATTGTPYLERLTTGTAAATLLGRYTLELGAVSRGTTISGVALDGSERNARVRADQDFDFGALSLESEVGRSTEANGTSRIYTDASVGGRHSFRRADIGLWVERYSGGSITKGSIGSTTIGGDLSARIDPNTEAAIQGYATRLRTGIDASHTQLDGRITHRLRSGATLTLRARLLSGGSIALADQSVAYLEYGVPLRLPVSRLRTPGRVAGRIVDASTGKGVAGALVRLGPQIAITDARGEVAFGGVPGGEHRVSMSQETSFADVVFVGDPTLKVDSTRTQPTTFELAIAHSARLDINVRRYTSARTGIAGAPDSLTEAGPVANAMLVLTGERDTLYRTTSDNGTASFTDVPPGSWVVTIRGDAPAYHRFDPDRVELTLAAGETRPLDFRLVPRRREVQLIGDGQELRPSAADPKAPPASGTTRIIRPNQRQD